jgi:hypothetical protein
MVSRSLCFKGHSAILFKGYPVFNANLEFEGNILNPLHSVTSQKMGTLNSSRVEISSGALQIDY